MEESSKSKRVRHASLGKRPLGFWSESGLLVRESAFVKAWSKSELEGSTQGDVMLK